MYKAYFQFRGSPFALTPDPHFLFLSRQHREALAHLLYGVKASGGFVMLTGEVGTGKTTLCRALLEQIPPEVDVAFILNPRQTAPELVGSICDELGIAYPPATDSLKVLVECLNGRLLRAHAEGRRTVLIIDEAQNLSPDVLEQLRLLTNLETAAAKLLQVMLVGQPELRALMERREMRQLAQRITARYHLRPLGYAETSAYVAHRLAVVGCTRTLFRTPALRHIYRRSGGIPRLINALSDRALLAAYAKTRRSVSWFLARNASKELAGNPAHSPFRRTLAWSLTGLGVLVLLGALTLLSRPPSVFWRLSPAKPDKQLLSSSGSGHESETEIPVSSEAADTLPNGDARSSFSRLIEQKSEGTTLPAAFSALFRCWKKIYTEVPGDTACERAAAAGLTCLWLEGNWTTLRHFNRPAVLFLEGNGGTRHHVVLVSMDKDTVTLDVGGERLDLSRAPVEALWYGEFVILWKPPPFPNFPLREGSKGEEVLWLRERMDRITGSRRTRGEIAPKAVFDKELEARVMEFQRANHLRADGVVGERTWIQINSALEGPAVPRLWQPGTEKEGKAHVRNP